MSWYPAESELLDSFLKITRGVLNSLAAYDRRKDPGELDKLYHLAKYMSSCTDDILEDIAISLSMFEELQLTNTMMLERDILAWIFQGTVGILTCYGF